MSERRRPRQGEPRAPLKSDRRPAFEELKRRAEAKGIDLEKSGLVLYLPGEPIREPPSPARSWIRAASVVDGCAYGNEDRALPGNDRPGMGQAWCMAIGSGGPPLLVGGLLLLIAVDHCYAPL